MTELLRSFLTPFSPRAYRRCLPPFYLAEFGIIRTCNEPSAKTQAPVSHTTFGAKFHRSMVADFRRPLQRTRMGLQEISNTNAARTNAQGGLEAICRISRAIRRC